MLDAKRCGNRLAYGCYGGQTCCGLVMYGIVCVTEGERNGMNDVNGGYVDRDGDTAGRCGIRNGVGCKREGKCDTFLCSF